MRNLHFKNAWGKGSFNTFNHKSYSEAFEIWLVWTQTRYLQQTRYRWVYTVDICRWWTLCGLAVACLPCHARRRLYSLPGAKDMNQTALFYAARQGHVETIRYLISKVVSLCWWGILLFLRGLSGPRTHTPTLWTLLGTLRCWAANRVVLCFHFFLVGGWWTRKWWMLSERFVMVCVWQWGLLRRDHIFVWPLSVLICHGSNSESSRNRVFDNFYERCHWVETILGHARWLKLTIDRPAGNDLVLPLWGCFTPSRIEDGRSQGLAGRRGEFGSAWNWYI